MTNTPRLGTGKAPDLPGAVVRAAGQPAPVPLPNGLLLASTPDAAKYVLANPEIFAMPHNVSRQKIGPEPADASAADAQPDGPATAGRSRPGIGFLGPDGVERGRQVFATELSAELSAELATELASGLSSGLSSFTPASPEQGARVAVSVDAMRLLRNPVARSTAAALLPDLDIAARDEVADLTLAWIDALGPVISSPRPPSRWSRTRRREQRSLSALTAALAAAGCSRPRAMAVGLAAGVQVPIAAGAWVLVVMTTALEEPADPVAIVWETLRLFPPTWMLPRITKTVTTLGSAELPAGSPVGVSPVALGQLPDLVPGPESGYKDHLEFDPNRWSDGGRRPGSWLPFGAGPHSCPGRNLGMAQLVHLATWASQFDLSSDSEHRVNSSRGLFPDPAVVRIEGGRAPFVPAPAQR